MRGNALLLQRPKLFRSFHEHQFGFRQNHSTNHAPISLTEQIRKALENNNNVGGVFIDLQKGI